MFVDKIRKISALSQTLRLLYVEDNESVRLSNIELLKNFFSDIDTATNGKEGWEKFQANAYDIVITDINMPYMSGIEMIHHIRQINQDVTILIVSAYSDVEYFTSSIKVGIQGYVIKPTSIEQLIDVLENCMRFIEDKQIKKKYQQSLEDRADTESKKRQETEAMLIQQSKMASMGEMIGNIAHQWRQPLNELSLLIQSFKSAYEREMLDKAFIDARISKGMLLIEMMSDTIENFSNFYSPSKSKSSFSIIDSINKSLAIFEGSFRNNDIEFLLEYEEGGNYLFYGYSDEFEQVFVNLLSNAKDAIIEKNMGDRMIYIYLQSSESAIKVELRDSGMGIREDVKSKLFEPYFTTKDDDKGTGIGLYMSKEIVEKHLKGSIEADNTNFTINGKEYSGALFTVTLPYAKESDDEL